MKDSYFLVCPRCASRNVGNDLSTSMIAWNSSTRYLCRDCQYSAITFPEITEANYDEFVAELKKRTKDDEKVLADSSVLKGNQNRYFGIGYLIILVSGLAYSLVHFFDTVSNNILIIISVGIAACAFVVLIIGLLKK